MIILCGLFLFFYVLLEGNFNLRYMKKDLFIISVLFIILVPKIDDIPQPTIDYEKLRTLCSIEGLKGRYRHLHIFV